MAPPEKEESGGSGITGTLAAVGIVCGFVGAVIGAFGWDMWKKEEEHQHHQSRSGYVIHSRVKVRVAGQLWKVSRELYGS